MILADTQIERLMEAAKRTFGKPVRVQFSAGEGCTVLSVFERDTKGPQIPLSRTYA